LKNLVGDLGYRASRAASRGETPQFFFDFPEGSLILPAENYHTGELSRAAQNPERLWDTGGGVYVGEETEC